MNLTIISENREDIKEVLYCLAIKNNVKIQKLEEEYRYNKRLYELNFDTEMDIVDNIIASDGKNIKSLSDANCDII